MHGVIVVLQTCIHVYMYIHVYTELLFVFTLQ